LRTRQIWIGEKEMTKTIGVKNYYIEKIGKEQRKYLMKLTLLLFQEEQYLLLNVYSVILGG
jgi:hypothetical protein